MSVADKLDSNLWIFLRLPLGGTNDDVTFDIVCVVLGGPPTASSATTQSVVATSSGEAEFYALAKSASRAIGAVAMAADMAKVVKPRVRVDATASKAIASRRGGAKSETPPCPSLVGAQEAVTRRELTIAKVPGYENPADLWTKHLA